MAAYEEVWRELPFRKGPEGGQKGISWVLESEDNRLNHEEGVFLVNKVFIGRLWGTYLALQQVQTHTRRRTASGEWSVIKTGGEVSARREEWDSGWKAIYVTGSVGSVLPSMMSGLDGEGEGSWTVPGETVEIQGKLYIVRAFECIR